MEEDIKKYTEGVSVVIVTYNGRKRLADTLNHLSNQKNINFNFEIIIVDNNSNDGTSETALHIWEDLGSPFELRIVIEKNPGTMYARKRGIEESNYRYMLYCDDDNWLSDEYVSTAYNIINKNDMIAAVGGYGELVFEKNFDIPNWIWNYENNFGGPQSNKDGDITFKKGCLYTAGAILDIKWLDKLYKLGFTSTLKGRDGKSLVAGEDTELTFALKIIGGQLHYSSKMAFKHFMPKERINWVYLRKLWYSHGVANYVLSPWNIYFNNIKEINYLIDIAQTIKSLFVLYLKSILYQTSEGDKIELQIEKCKGRIYSLFNYRNMYLNSKKNIDLLKIVSKN